jgi:hypothetical protein
MVRILIEAGKVVLSAELNDTETAKAVAGCLPVSGTANVWGEEIYFSIPLHLEPAKDARTEVEVGDLGFWPAGDAFCIFFGPTPVSRGKKFAAYSPVNIFGKIDGDAKLLRKVSTGNPVKVRKEEKT